MCYDFIQQIVISDDDDDNDVATSKQSTGKTKRGTKSVNQSRKRGRKVFIDDSGMLAYANHCCIN